MSVVVLRGRRPPGVVRAALWAGASLALGTGLWTGTLARELAAGTSLDPGAVLLRVLALACTVRVVAHLSELMRRLLVWWRSGASHLTLEPDELILEGPGSVRRWPRDSVATVVAGRDWQEESDGYFPVYLLSVPDRPAFTSLPPIFDEGPASLAERLMRWLGPPSGPCLRSAASAVVPSRRYDEASQRGVNSSSLALPHGWGWLRRGPFASILLGAALVDGWTRAGAFSDSWVPWAFLVGLLLVPLGWVALTLRALAPRRGLSMVLEADSLLLRGAGGTVEVPYASLREVRIDRRWSWSIADGLHQVRVLELRRGDEPPIRYDDAFLGVPVAVAAGWIETLRQRASLVAAR